jgi:hypothetical protein
MYDMYVYGAIVAMSLLAVVLGLVTWITRDR